jgi:hypothetical protein
MPAASDLSRARQDFHLEDIDKVIAASEALRDVGKRLFASGDMRGQAMVTMARATAADLLEHLEKQ